MGREDIYLGLHKCRKSRPVVMLHHLKLLLFLLNPLNGLSERRNVGIFRYNNDVLEEI